MAQFNNASRPLANGNGSTTSDNAQFANVFSSNYNNPAQIFGHNIWSNRSEGLTNNNHVGSKVATRDSSCDVPKRTSEKEQAQGGAKMNASLGLQDTRPGQLLDSKWAPQSGRSHVKGANGQASHQQRSASNGTLGTSSNSSQVLGSASLLDDLPRLNTTNGSASSIAPPYPNAPDVYTKWNRPEDANPRRKNEPITGNMRVGGVSPTDTRGLRSFGQPSRTVSQTMSRANSQSAVQMQDERQLFTGPTSSRGSQASMHHDSRAPSVSSRRDPYSNTFSDPTVDHLALQLGQFGMNGDARPQNVHRSSDSAYAQPFSTAISPYSRSSLGGASAGFEAQDEVEEIDNLNNHYLGFPTSLSPISTSFHGYNPAARFPPSPTSMDFRPGQTFASHQIAPPRSYDVPTGPRAEQRWQAYANGPFSPSRQFSGAIEPQIFYSPHFQQMLAAQYRSPYGTMCSPYSQLSQMQYGISLPLTNLEPMTPPHDLNVGESVQSALLYEFKTNTKSRRYELRDIYDHIAEFAGDQHGSRFIQTKLETANSDEKERVFREIEPNAYQLMTDVFGNYVIQKFFEHGDQIHKKTLANCMRGHVYTLSMQMYGCRVVQKALDHVLVDQQAMLISELDQQVLACVKDQNGNHVIQKAIERCPPSSITFIIASFQGEVQHLSVNSYGCRVIQRCLERCDPPAKAMIMAELMDGIQGMITDQYGNYVVQHVVEHDEAEGRRRVLNIVAKNLELYSKHKFASNVVEKCLERADDSWRRDVIYALANNERRGMDGDGVLVSMIKDNFGNYVIQKLLDTLGQQDYFLFLDILQPAVTQAKRTGCGKQLQSVERKMDKYARNRYINNHGYGHHPPTGPSAGYNTPQYSQGLFAPSFAHSNYASAGTTPPPLTADQSRQSSTLQSLNGDAVEGAHHVGRKGGEMVGDGAFMR